MQWSQWVKVNWGFKRAATGFSTKRGVPAGMNRVATWEFILATWEFILAIWELILGGNNPIQPAGMNQVAT